MNKTRVVINHLNRIGKLFLFHLLNNENFELVGIFTVFDAPEIIAFLKNDSNHGKFWGQFVTVQKNINNVKLKYNFANQKSKEITLYNSKMLNSETMKELNADVLVNFDDSVRNKTFQEWTKLVKRFVISGVVVRKNQKDSFEAITYGVNHTKILKEKSKMLFINPIETTILTNLIKKISKKIKINTCYFQILTGPNDNSKFLDSLQKNRHGDYFARSVINNIIQDEAKNNIETLKTALKQQRYTIIVKGEKFIVPVTTGAHLSVMLGMENIHDEEEIRHLINEVSDSLIAFEKDALSSQDIVSTNHFAVIDGTLIKLLNSRSNKILKIGLWYDTESSQAISFFKTLEFIAN